MTPKEQTQVPSTHNFVLPLGCDFISVVGRGGVHSTRLDFGFVFLEDIVELRFAFLSNFLSASVTTLISYYRFVGPQELGSDGREFTFVVRSQRHSFYFQAETKEAVDQWFNYVRVCSRRRKSQVARDLPLTTNDTP